MHVHSQAKGERHRKAGPGLAREGTPSFVSHSQWAADPITWPWKSRSQGAAGSQRSGLGLTPHSYHAAPSRLLGPLPASNLVHQTVWPGGQIPCYLETSSFSPTNALGTSTSKSSRRALGTQRAMMCVDPVLRTWPEVKEERFQRKWVNVSLGPQGGR